MRRLALSLALICGLGCGATAYAQSMDMGRDIAGARPQWASQAGIDAMRSDILVSLPPGFEIKDRTIGPDFMIFNVSKGDVGYVGIYYGNHPNFPIDKTAVVVDGPIPSATSTAADGAVTHEYLVASSRTEEPYVLHVWTMAVPAGEAAVAAAIAASVRAR
jgi:hypothetical protein